MLVKEYTSKRKRKSYTENDVPYTPKQTIHISKLSYLCNVE